MRHPSHRIRRRDGFSLVEMMVVLFIMASLATVATVSLGTSQDKVRADKTAAIGREVVEALERSDGLSFVSDFGRLPQDEEELLFLFENEIENASADEHVTILLTLDSSATTKTYPSDVIAHFNSLELKMGMGWRGPYTRSTTLESDPTGLFPLRDGWGSEWEVETDGSGITGLTSGGRDGVGMDSGEWQDEDRTFLIRSSDLTTNASLQVQIDHILQKTNRSSLEETDFTTFNLYAVLFTPKSDSAMNPKFEEVELTSQELESTSFSLPPFNSLSVGQRMVFVFASGIRIGETAEEYFVSQPRLLHIRPGVNPTEDFTLTEL